MEMALLLVAPRSSPIRYTLLPDRSSLSQRHRISPSPRRWTLHQQHSVAAAAMPCRASRSCCRAERRSGDSVTRKRLAVFVSGGGSNFKSIHKATMDGTISGDVVIVVSDKPECKACKYAEEHNIPLAFYPKTKSSPNGVSPNELVEILRQQRVDFVLLAGYLKLVPKELVEAFPRAILNVHPALLPAFGGKGFYGLKVHEAVIASGARVSGPTIHFVDEKYDHGSILAQRTVPVLEADTPQDLAARVLEQEHALYVETVAALCDGRIEWSSNGAPLIRKSES